jgi:hypothetical protein
MDKEIAIFDQESKNLISSCKFFSILGHQTLDPDPELEKCWIWIRIRIKSMRIRNPARLCNFYRIHKQCCGSVTFWAGRI